MTNDITTTRDELLMQRITGQLSGAEQLAFAQLTQPVTAEELRLWEEAAAELTAIIALDARADADALPASVAERVTRDGLFHVRRATVSTLPRKSVTSPMVAGDRSARTLLAWSGWMAAAAAVVLWIAAPRRAETRDQPTAVAATTPTAGELRDALRADSIGSRVLAWSAAGDSTGRVATGDVIWNGTRQAGVMRFVGLAANDARRWQYQLWIFDRSRDERYPVDGGVFDIPPGATEVLVPITAKVKVTDAMMFAVTVEAPGGVVVSSRERLALIAKAGG
jgi:hypothetical protein